MAMPSDFWRDEQMLNVFRTKPCNRLARDGVCEWKSRCQFSHCVEWPRRPPHKYMYCPEMCPLVEVEAEDGSPPSIKNRCNSGLTCTFAHTLEEVLFHPNLFKTSVCEEHSSNSGSQHSSRRGKRARCHRFYCPFAHGSRELRTSPLSEERREKCLRVIGAFPSDDCCTMCSPHRLAVRKPTPEPKTQGAVQPQKRCLPAPPPFPPPPPTSAVDVVARLVPELDHEVTESKFLTKSDIPLSYTPCSMSSDSTCAETSRDPLLSLKYSPVFITFGDDGSTTFGPNRPSKISEMALV
eukprot:TRINITY_DN61729_c0_g1_i1.p1 TRINITY_DN61729_c0_g1~~TRINITY_DN61729_c0_g1_i1.p1  ORF type:complete len:295 (-),score=37.95 TRINITY_DN61729_c0_g1_i1:478-1362(-)